MWNNDTTEYYSSIDNLQNIMLSEINQTEDHILILFMENVF